MKLCYFQYAPASGNRKQSVNLWRLGKHKISDSIRCADMIETVKYSVFKGEFPYKRVYDAPSPDEQLSWKQSS